MSQQNSLYRLFNEINLIVPVAILAASVCIFSNSFFSFWEQLSHITSAYSKIGLINTMQMVSKEFLSTLNFNFLIILILNQAFFFDIVDMFMPTAILRKV